MAQDQSTSTGFIAPTLEELVPLFPAYELESFIAQGGMGAVYKATQKSLDRPVAIKILPSEFGDDPQFRASFEAEAKAMARLNHPNLISVYDFGDVEGMLYIVMEFVQGKALYYSSHNKAIDPSVALDLVSTICRGLAHAHRGGIIHRDIKPANILLDTEAKPKIGDFGLAHPVDRGKDDGVVFGTPGYTAPEIFQRGVDIDQRSDIFSVGALLYELIAGRHPEANSHGMTTGTDPRIDAIIKKATNSDPALRYDDVDILADKLDELLPKLAGPKFATGTGSKQSPVIRPSTVLASSKQKSSALPIIFLLIVLIGGATAAYLIFQDSKTKKTTESPAVSGKDQEQQIDRKPRKKERNPAKRNKADRKNLAGKNKPKTKDSPPPVPEPEKINETPLQALDRLAVKLQEGNREEFPLGTIKEGESAFFLHQEGMTWDAANQFAITHGAHLAVLSSKKELEWFHENFKSDSPVWLGGSDSGFEKKWFWTTGAPIKQSLWAAGSPNNQTKQSPNGEDFLATASDKPVLEDHYRLNELPFLLEWKLDGSTPASLESQLALTGDALKKKKTPIFPAGTYDVGGSRFLIVEKTTPWEAASTMATNAGGHLAVPSNESEATFIGLTLKDRLEDDYGCWLGARRSTDVPEIWQYVTGESFTFIEWLEGQPDNVNETEDRLAFTKTEDKMGASDEDTDEQQVSHFIIEWSVPSRRNMPSSTVQNAGEEKLLAALEVVRDMIRERHGRDYRKFKKKKDEIIEDFVENTITAINNQERLGPPIKARLVEEVKKFIDENKLPDELPRMAPKKLQDELKDAKEELKELTDDYEEDFEDAKNDYLDLLVDTSKEAVKKGAEAEAKMLILENTVTEKDDNRFRMILDKEKVPLPREPKAAEEDENK